MKSFRDRFEDGFKKKLIEEEGATEEEALEVVDKIWTIINDAASYMFCAAHAFSMACDSLYAAWLKAHYPYEFYTCMLKLYTEKGNKEKIAAITSEMDRYKGIKVTAGRFGQDNRDWVVDKENHTISQNLNSIKYISSNVATALYKLANRNYDSFTDLLRDMLFETQIDSRQTEVLISLDYFEKFGGSKKLKKVYENFKEGTNKITETLKEATIKKRIEQLKEEEKKTEDEELPIYEKLKAEHEYLGRCVSYNKKVNSNCYFVDAVDDKYGVKVQLYSMQRGTTGVMKCAKNLYAKHPLKEAQCLYLKRFERKPRYTYHDGQRFEIEGVTDCWMLEYEMIGEAA